jgi:hypothetical protein
MTYGQIEELIGKLNGVLRSRNGHEASRNDQFRDGRGGYNKRPLINRSRFLYLAFSAVFFADATLPAGARAAGQTAQPRATSAAAVRQLEKNLFAIGPIRVDTARREVSVPATVNDALTLEFVASTRNGLKGYESALSVDTDAITFNAALLLIGLDPKHGVPPKRHFDPATPEGDPVEISLTWKTGDQLHRVHVEEILFDRRTSKPLADGPWVYTGSVFVDGGVNAPGPRYAADIDGVLIGFVHSPSPMIENPRKGAVDSYGAVVMNPNLGLATGAPVTLIIKALPIAASAPR